MGAANGSSILHSKIRKRRDGLVLSATSALRFSSLGPLWSVPDRWNVSNANDFRKQAEDARKTAARAIKPEDKAFWLRLAEDWNRLAQDIDQRATEAAKT